MFGEILCWLGEACRCMQQGLCNQWPWTHSLLYQVRLFHNAILAASIWVSEMSAGGSWGAEERTEDLLISAAMWGDIPLLESLLENNADPNLPNAQGNSPLHIAAYYGETECASLLLSYKGELSVWRWRGGEVKTGSSGQIYGWLHSVCYDPPWQWSLY